MASGVTGNNSFLNGMKWTFGAILALLITAALLRSLFSFFPSTIVWQLNPNSNTASYSSQLQSTTAVPPYVPIETRPQPAVAATINNTVPDPVPVATDKKASVSNTPTATISSTKKIREPKPLVQDQEQPSRNSLLPNTGSTNRGRIANYKEVTASEKTTALPTVSKNPYSSIRTFTRMEMEEFMRQFPSRTTDIRFIRFTNPTSEMEGLKAQIIQMLQQHGYTNIDKGWRTIGEFSSPLEVHFGGAGYNAANFYIPIMQ